MNNYTEINSINQTNFNESGTLFLPTSLKGFINTDTKQIHTSNSKDYYFFLGSIELQEEDTLCPNCGCKMYKHDSHEITLRHLPIGPIYTYIKPTVYQFQCDNCGYNQTQNITFKADGYRITKALKNYVEDLLSTNKFTLTDIAKLTGLDRATVKDIDKKRLLGKYTVKNGDRTISLIQPEQQAQYLAIDEFKLHDGYKYATHIIDLETGHILWIAEGKKKQVVYDFINHVGLDWMSKVIAVGCDMNSDFEEAFKEKCPNIKIVYDRFHIVKHLNETIGDIRKDGQSRLKNEGDIEGYKSLKKSRYILTSSMKTLEQKDKEVEESKVISKGNELFKKPDIVRKGKYRERYETIINNNETLLVAELLKELLTQAYETYEVNELEDAILDAMWLCEQNGNKHLIKFMNLLYNHLDGIVTHAEYHISSGKIEGINNKIKTVRRQAYGLPDDEYFFLKCFDLSRV